MTPESLFPPGTPVRVTQTIARRDGDYHAEVVGVVEAWQDRPTGSWYAHGRHDKLWLRRLSLRQHDGELTVLVVDDGTTIARLEPAQPG